MIKQQIRDVPPQQKGPEDNFLKKVYFDSMKPLVSTEGLIDEEEKSTYDKYLSIPKTILKMGTLDYHSYLRRKPGH